MQLKRMFVRQAGTIFLLAAFLFVSSSHISHAGFNPLKSIGDGLGSIAGGIGGIFGQGLAGLAGPTVNETANTLQRVADETIAKAKAAGQDLLHLADVAAEQRIEQVSAVMTTQIEDVDGRIQEHLRTVDEILTTKLGSADIIATKQINSFESALMDVVRYGSIALLVSVALCVLFYVVVTRWKPNLSPGSFAPGLAYGLILLAVFSAIAAGATSLLRPPSDKKLEAIRAQLLTSYRDSIHSGDLDSAVFFASQFSSLDAADLAPRFLVQFADLQRDLLRRSALFTSENGNRELKARVSQIGRTWDIVADTINKRAELSFLKYEVPATASMIAWQNASKVVEQQRAACTAAVALNQFALIVPNDGDKTEQASGYVWLAAAYVNWEAKTDPSWSQARLDAACAGYDVPLANAIKTSTFFTDHAADASANISPVFKFNVASADFFRDVSIQYVNAAVGDSQYRAYSDSAQVVAAKAMRDAALDRIDQRWDEFTKSIVKISDLPGQDVVLSASGLPLGIIARAKLMRGSDRPMDTASPPNIGAPPARVALANDCKPLEAIHNLFSPTSFDMLCVNQQAVDAKLQTFEDDLQKAFAGGPQIRKNLIGLASDYIANRPEMLSLVTSLPSCIIPDNGAISGFSVCPADSKKAPDRFIEWLAQPDGGAVNAIPNENAFRVAMTR